MKTKIMLIILIMLMASSVVMASSNSGRDKFVVTMNGSNITFTEEMGSPVLLKENQRTLIPLRVVSEELGYEVDWSHEKQEAYINGEGKNIIVPIGSDNAIVNGKSTPMDGQEGTQAMLIEAKGSHRTYVPLRFVVEALGLNVKYEWKAGVHYIDIYKGGDLEEIIVNVSDAKVDTDKHGLAKDIKFADDLAEKHDFSIHGLGRGYFIDHKKNQTADFIEPVFHVTGEISERDWFNVLLMNRKEYEGKGYEVRYTSESHPNISESRWRMIEAYGGRSFPRRTGGNIGDVVEYQYHIKAPSGQIKTYKMNIRINPDFHDVW